MLSQVVSAVVVAFLVIGCVAMVTCGLCVIADAELRGEAKRDA